MEPFILVLGGIGIATVAMSVGIGGGILWTPLLILGFGATAQEAVATSLLIQVAGMGSGTVVFARAKLVETKLASIFIVAALPGVIIGCFISFSLSPDIVQMALGIMALTLAVLFVSHQDDYGETLRYKFNASKVMQIAPIPAFCGFLMGSLSVGIGEWLVPALRSRLKLEMRRSIATVIPMMFVLAATASFVQWMFADNIIFQYVIFGGIGTIIGGQIGARISQRINERLLKQGFIYLMTLIGIHLIFQAV